MHLLMTLFTEGMIYTLIPRKLTQCLLKFRNILKTKKTISIQTLCLHSALHKSSIITVN